MVGFKFKRKTLSGTGRVSNFIQKTVVYEISVTNSLLACKKHVQIRAQNNGSVSKSVSQTVLRLSFDGFAPGIVRLTHLEQVEQFFSYVAPKTGCPDTQNKNSVTPCHFYTKIIIFLHEKSGVERNDHFTKLSL